MKSYIKPVIFGIVILVLAIFIIERACPRSDAKYQKLKGEYSMLKKELKKSKDVLVEQIKASDKENKELETGIEELKQENLKLDREILETQKKDDEKAQIIYDLKKEGETLTDPNLIIANQNLLLNQWESRWVNEREEKEKIIKQRNYWAAIAFKQYGKYQSEHHLRKSLEKQLAGEEALDKVGEEIVKEGDRQIKALSLKLNFKNILYSAVFFGLGYVAGAL